MQITRLKWNPSGRFTNYVNIFIIMFWISLLLGLINIVGLTCYIFINPSDAMNASFGQKLYLGFYEVLIGNKNQAFLQPMAIVLGVSVILNTFTCIITYWSFKNTRFLTLINNVHLSSLLIIIVVFIVSLFLINVFNRPILEYKNLDIINNGWNTNVNDDNYIIKFNYVYDIHLINLNGSPVNAIFVNSNFFAIWVIIICIFSIILFIFIVVLFYNADVSIWFPRRRI